MYSQHTKYRRVIAQSKDPDGRPKLSSRIGYGFVLIEDHPNRNKIVVCPECGYGDTVIEVCKHMSIHKGWNYKVIGEWLKETYNI